MPKTLKILMISLLAVVSLAISFSAGCVLRDETPSSAELGMDVVEEVREFAENILEVSTTASRVIGDVEKGLMTADVQKLQAQSGDLQKMTKALEKVLPASKS